jgi:hypothetical protein
MSPVERDAVGLDRVARGEAVDGNPVMAKLDQWQNDAMTIRPATPGERCICGREAVIVYVFSEPQREVPYCGVNSGAED